MTTKERSGLIVQLEGQICELTLERNRLRSAFLGPKKKPFDAPRHSIEVKLLGEIPNPFIQGGVF